ncbi:hypothetical protein AB685_29635 [Bacillus sp. LL01]|uniref:hypothetical protein n=1 Tax=Bacillus sp. LL01 TaxID=1665556 RepID=UPI00064D56B1|nr:hypothetical protein [Bacillus sp. LL01]KMJ54987.1 hypothetical protein AB685_29635 [Bacillus sp. LL01]
MENTLQRHKVKSFLKVFLLVLTIISMSFIIWAGFTGKESIFPYLLSVTLFFSFSNLLLIDENPAKQKFYRFIFIMSGLSVVFAIVNLIFRG